MTWLQQASDDFNKPLKASVGYGLNLNPDATAKSQASAKQLDIPLDLVDRQEEEVNKIARQREILKKLQDTKHVKKAFEKPDFAAIAHDDIESLVKIEGVTSEIKSLRGPEPDLISTAKGLGVGFTQGLEKIRQGIRLQWADLIGSERMREDAMRKYELAETETIRFDPEFETSTARGIYGGLTSITRQGPALIASIATRNPALVLGYMGQTVEAESYGKYRLRGAEPGEALIGAMGEAAVEVATELMPMGFLVKKFGKTGAGDFLTGILAREVPGEQIATIVQDAIDTAIANPDKTWGDYVKERPEAAYETLIATLVQSGVVGGLSSVSRFGGDANQAQIALDEQESLGKQVEAAAESKLRTRSPEEYKNFLDNILGAEDEVFIPAEDANVFFQSNPEILESLPEDVMESIQESLETNNDVAIKKSDYLTYLSDHHEELAESLRNDVDGMTAKEANEWVEQGTEQFEEEAERILAEMEMESEFTESADRVAENIKSQIKGFTPEAAEKYAQIHKNFAVSMADRLGILPEEVYEQFGLQVTGAPLTGETALTRVEGTTPKQGEIPMATPQDVSDLTGERGDWSESPYLLADGSVVGTGQDHLAYSNSRGYELQEDFQLRANAIRSSFHWDAVTGKYVVFIELYEGQKLAPKQLSLLRAIEKDVEDRGGMKILIGISPVTGKHINKNPEYKEISFDELEKSHVNVRLTIGDVTGDVLAQPETIEQFSENLERDLGLTSLNVFESKGDIKLDTIIVPKEKRKQGVGSEAMQRIVDYADSKGMRVILTPAIKDDLAGTTSRSRLVKFYKRFGFVENKGRNKDFTISAGMYRTPQALYQPEYRGALPDIDIAGTPEFIEWAGTDEILESEEISESDFKKEGPFVMRVYHGTTHDFDEFIAEKKGTKEGQFGAVNYFTSSEYDAEINYAGVGPDLTSRVERRTEQLEQQLEFEPEELGYTSEQVEELGASIIAQDIANKEMVGGEGRIMELYVKTENPFVVGDESPWLEFIDIEGLESVAMARVADDQEIDVSEVENNRDDYEDQIDEARWEIEADEPNKLIEAITTVAERNNIPPEDILGDLYEYSKEGISHSLLEKLLRETQGIQYAEEIEFGDLIGHHVLGQIIQELGFDSIILKDAEKRFPGMEMEQGTSHVHVFDANNTNIKSVENIGTFDPRIANIFLQDKRGAFDPDKNVISLLENADLSTFLHESGHFFFEAYKTLAQENPEIMKDMKTLLDFVEIPDLETWNGMTLEERREGHEKVARAFESYLFEGKAPSIEMQSLFQTFRAWLLNVYKSLRNLNVELTDEVRQVFDRMLATDEQIRAKEVQNAYQPLFESQEESGMTDKQWVEYQNMDERRKAMSEGELQTRSLRDMKWLSGAKSKALKAIQRDARAKRKDIKSEVTEDVNKEPVYVAKEYIRGIKKAKPKHDNLYTFLKRHGGIDVADDKGLAGILKPYNKEKGPLPGIAQTDKGISLSKAAELATEAGYIELADGLVDENALLDILTMEDAGKDSYTPEGLDEQARLDFESTDNIAQEINMIYGTEFTSGEHLKSEITAAPNKKVRIEQLTDQRMLEAYGDLTNPEAIDRAVEEAVHNQAHTKFLHTELSNLTKRSGVGNVLSRAAKSYAEEAISRKKVKNIKPYQYSVAETRAARNAEKSIIKGDRASAAEHKRAQVLNNHFFRAANNARNDIDKMLRYFKKFNNEGTRKNLDPDYRDQIDSLLEKYDFRKASLKEIEKRKSLSEWIESQEALGFNPIIGDDLQGQHYKETPYEELKGLKDTIKNIEHLARLKNKLLKAKAQRELMEAADTVGGSIRNFSTGKNEIKLEHNSWLDRAKKGKAEFFAMHRKFASLAREMDGGKDGGPMWEYFIRTMNEGGDFEAVQNELATISLQEIFKPLEKDDLRKKTYIKEIDNSLSLEGMIVIGLNQGNETNQRRILDGDGWTPDQVSAILDNLTKEHWDVIQTVWDFIDSYWPQISEKELRVTGLAPEKVERLVVQTKFGEYSGGYYPIKYDPENSTKSEQQNEVELAKQSMLGKISRATTRRGHTKQRVDTVKRPVRKDLGVVFEHTGQVIHDLAWHEWLIDTNRLLNTKQIDSAIREGYGPEVLKTIRKAIEDIASGDVPAQHYGETILNHLRVGATIAGIGLNLWTSALQPLGLFQSVKRIGPKWVGRGMSEFFGSAIRMENAVKNINEKSSFMRLRGKTQQREINEIRNKVAAGGKLKPIQDTYFYFIMRAQQMADVPTWLGAYEKAVYEKNDEPRSVALADQAVLDSQGGGAIKDLAQVQRGSPGWKLFTNFYSYFSVTWNLTVESYASIKTPQDVGRFAVDMLLLYTLPATFSALMREALKGDCTDEACIVEQVVRENLSYMSGVLVGAREISGVVQGYYGYAGPAGARFFSEIGKLAMQIEQGEMDKAAWKALNNTMGILFHYPSGQVQRMVEGFIATMEGDVEGAAIAPAVLFGPPR